ncbi:hypothetical protein [Vibrio quintilis]|uniref:Uncharacterized protein n=1 Tax=Vibrio quintilis TaxID=1117707 RepID=A0A1M7Z2D3_9VIBR|nr:hypothetical protein [Vibrio quintilis]SHO59127.1 hypothetical protein VQ7734_04904 [Vibrio quintilis]
MHQTPIHSINIDFSHSGEAKALLNVLGSATHLSPLEFQMRERVVRSLLEAAELLECLEE